MRKKQLFAILLAGAMTAGTVPSAALAAENDIPAASSEVTEGENSGEIPQEEGGETTPEACLLYTSSGRNKTDSSKKEKNKRNIRDCCSDL